LKSDLLLIFSFITLVIGLLISMFALSAQNLGDATLGLVGIFIPSAIIIVTLDRAVQKETKPT